MKYISFIVLLLVFIEGKDSCVCRNAKCPIVGYNNLNYTNGYGIYEYIMNKNDIPIVSNVYVKMSKSTLDTGSITTDCTVKYAKIMNDIKSEDVDAGHIFAHRLGGYGNQPINIFPQNPHINRGIYQQYEKFIYTTIVNNCDYINDYIELMWNFVYVENNNTRPYSINYKITFNCNLFQKSFNKLFLN